MSTINPVIELAHNQNVNLLPHLGDVYKYNMEVWFPTPEMVVITNAAGKLQEEPDIQLADRPIAEIGWPTDTASQLIRTMINTSLIPEEQRPKSQVSFRSMQPTLDFCRLAERGFVRALKTVQALGRFGTMPKGKEGVRLLVDADNEPRFLQKSGIRSLLALVPFEVDGIRYPAGSIAQAKFSTKHGEIPHNKLDVVSIDDIERLAFLRLSLFAFSPEERAPLLKKIGLLERRRKTRRHLTIDHVAVTARQAIQKLIGPDQSSRPLSRVELIGTS